MTPADGSTKVSYLSTISLEFDKSLDPASIDATTVRVRVRDIFVPGTPTYDEASRTILFTPARPLERGSRHHIEIGDVKDLDGNTAIPVDLELSTYVNSPLRYERLDAGGKITGLTKYLLDGNGRPADSVVYRDPGQDGVWNTADDIADGRTSYAFREDGVELGWATYAGPGNDQRWNTADDVIAHIKAFTADEDEHILTSADAIGAGPDQLWGTDDDELGAHEVYVWEDGKNVAIVRYRSPGPDQKWRTPDDPVFERIEAEFDADGRRVRRTSRSAGPDAVWDTPDDVTNAHATHSYDEHGYELRTVSYTGGSSSVSMWTEKRHTPAGLLEYDFTYTGPGQDATWLTADDDGRYYGQAFDARGVVSAWARFEAGADKRVNTADDVKVQHVRYTTDAEGRYVEILSSINPGNDGVWGTSDDVHDNRAVFDLTH